MGTEGADEAEVDAAGFASRAGLDERATKGLLELNREGQHIVIRLMDQQANIRNASAATWAKIRAFKNQPAKVKAEYIFPLLDERATQHLGNLPQQIQDEIVLSIDVVSSRNLSARVWSKIKSMGLGHGAPSFMHVPTPPPFFGKGFAPMAHAPKPGPKGQFMINQSGAQLGLDEGATEALASLPAFEQKQILSMVDPALCRNPSAFVISKIMEYKKQGGQAMASQGGARERSRTPVPLARAMPMMVPMMPPMMPVQNSRSIHSALDEKAKQAIAEMPPDEGNLALAMAAEVPMCKNLSAVVWSKVKQVKENPMEVKLAFIKKSIDEKAWDAISGLESNVLADLFSDVDVTKCRNLSAVIWSKVKSAGLATAGGASSPVDARQRLDARVKDALSKLSMPEQEAVLEELNAQTDVKNPSAFVWSRVKALQSSS